MGKTYRYEKEWGSRPHRKGKKPKGVIDSFTDDSEEYSSYDYDYSEEDCGEEHNKKSFKKGRTGKGNQ